MKKLMCLMIALLMLPCAALAWEMGEPVPDDGQPDVFCGLSQQQVDEMFADTLNGLFTGETKEEIVRQGIGGEFGFHFPDMLWWEGKYWAYYITYNTPTGKGGVGLATSENGLDWEDQGCVIPPDADWDMNGAYFAGVWHDTDGTFYCAYECKGGEDTEYGVLENIALAVSSDGVHWEKEGVILYKKSSRSWQKLNIGTPDLYKAGDMWYLTFHGYSGSTCQISVAHGEDLHSLTMEAGPRIRTKRDTRWSGTTGRRDVMYAGGYYYMVYEISTLPMGYNGFADAKWSHMFARSTDMINWEITEGPQLIQMVNGEEVKGFGYDGPCWIVLGDQLCVMMREGGSTTAVALNYEKAE
ncbi:MAG: hypothetical protein E7333_03810 [Clostridiales bacterium]|nr:hypothetical protein [Clostridiales bacterium]